MDPSLKHSHLLRASADEDASWEAGHEVAGDAEARCQNVSGTVLHTVLLQTRETHYVRHKQTPFLQWVTGRRVSYVLILDQGLQLGLVRHVEDHSDPALFNDVTWVLHLLSNSWDSVSRRRRFCDRNLWNVAGWSEQLITSKLGYYRSESTFCLYITYYENAVTAAWSHTSPTAP